jgi:hypothetical protein
LNSFELTNEIALAELQPAISFPLLIVRALYGKHGALGSFPNTTHHIRHSIMIFMQHAAFPGMLQIMLDPLKNHTH